MNVASLFSGIGGFERGFEQAGHKTLLFAETLPSASAVLNDKFADTENVGDIHFLDDLPDGAEIVTAGFPCQDLSQAGSTLGLKGEQSGLVREVFRLIERSKPEWVVLENVPFMLQLSKGAAMLTIVDKLEELGYSWAWRVIDAYGFGLPQRRERVFVVASLTNNPATVLLSDDNPISRPTSAIGEKAHGFYWTEGRLGLGWAPDAIPTLKRGSALGIPSPPAILQPTGRIVTPDIRDAERLQGFPADWTKAAEGLGGRSHRWGLVGNAVAAPVAKWLGEKLNTPGTFEMSKATEFVSGGRLPRAAFALAGQRYSADVSQDPIGNAPIALMDFLEHEGPPLSHRASNSFLNRTKSAKLRFQPGFIDAVTAHVEWSAKNKAAA